MTRLDSQARRDGDDLQRQVRAPLALAAGPKARHLATRVRSTSDVVNGDLPPSRERSSIAGRFGRGKAPR